MISREGIVSLISFIACLSTQVLAVLTYRSKIVFLCALHILYFLVSITLLGLFLNSTEFQISVIAGSLGFAFGIGATIAILANEKYKSFGMYLSFLVMFHFSEYIIVTIFHPESLHPINSFMLNSFEYSIAAVCSWLEFFIEAHFLPKMKTCKMLWIIGSCFCMLGEMLRKAAIITAKKSFHQLIQFQKAETHKLVTHGVYSLVRHPSYAGWFLYSLGTQILIDNPICLTLYAIANYLFFKERIVVEEATLVDFFGDEYIKYRNYTPSGLPLIM